MTTAKKFAPGDRVASTVYGQRFGLVQRVDRGKIFVLWDGNSTAERARADALRDETAVDIAERDHRQAMRAWREARPCTEVARPLHSMRWGDDSVIGATVGLVKTPAEMRTAADELRLLADWFDARPKETP